MLLRYAVRNLGPFRDRAEFCLFPGKISKQHTNHVLEDNGFSSLKASAFFGANASGKTWALRVLILLRDMVLAEKKPNRLYGQQFAFGTGERTTSIEVDYCIHGTAYRYSIRTDGLSVLNEELSLLQKTGNTKSIFKREGTSVTLGTLLRKSKSWYEQRTLKSTSFFLSQVEADGIVELESVAGREHFINAFIFLSNIVGLDPHLAPLVESLDQRFNLDGYRMFLVSFLKRADLGIDDVRFELVSPDLTKNLLPKVAPYCGPYTKSVFFKNYETNEFYVLEVENKQVKAYRIQCVHQNQTFELMQESSGTLRMLELSIHFYKLSNPVYSVCLIIDEMDCRLHPFLAKYLIKTHLENTNSRSQLIVSLHEFFLMNHDLWRSDEIWLAEKDRLGATELYSLYQFKPRFDKSLEKGYRQGKFGAVPMLDELDFDVGGAS